MPVEVAEFLAGLLRSPKQHHGAKSRVTPICVKGLPDTGNEALDLGTQLVSSGDGFPVLLVGHPAILAVVARA